ncbi:tRNA1(Val) (adenine(37)-N6)-methyltransferase [Govanella unica]|uniref:Methyltransferase n=1 Tax=Govanella unica TaxID=2975056 RepID=A0A9X3TYY5_9PROT|nr:methyltransferase [Govania unica]MDA5194277.1 methyltransferase [Govania unica]
MVLTDDEFLGGRLRLNQPDDGYRIGGDSVLLAATVPARAGDRILDIGCGSGAIALCLAERLKSVTVTGLELQPELFAIASENATRNGLGDRVTIIEGDLAKAPRDLPRNAFDHVVTNPPYLDEALASPPPNAQKARAHMESHLGLREWVALSLKFLKPLGWLHVIQRADRLPDLLAGLDGRAGDIIVYPLWPKTGTAARRVIVRARKGGKGAMTLHPGLVLHEDNGRYTPEAEAALRTGAPLNF